MNYALSHSEESNDWLPSFLSLLNHFRLGACLIDAQGRILSFNHHAKRLCPCQVPTRCPRLLQADMTGATGDARHQGENRSPEEVCITLPDSSVHCLRESTITFLDRQKNVSQDFQQTLFDSSTVGIGLVDNQGQLRQANRWLCRMLGYPQEELLVMNFRNFTDPTDLHKNEKRFAALLNGKIETSIGRRFRK